MSKNTKNIVLVGFMGCGKSTLGKKIANKLGKTFVDMDAEIEKQEKVTISQIFETKGEAYFRQLEHDYLKSLVVKNNLVISTGGGTPCFFNNIEIINAIGKSVYIQLSPEALKNRLQNETNKRPLIANLSGIQLLEFITIKLKEREQYYLQSQIIFNASTTEESTLIGNL